MVVGAALLVLVIVTVLWAIWRRPDRLTILVGLAIIALAFFAAPTRVHERYGFPFFALGAILFAVSPRWRIAYVVLAIATFLNMYVVLTTIYPPDDPATNPVRDWLGIGSLIRSELGVTMTSLLHTVAVVWAWLQLRPRAADTARRRVRAAADAGAGDGATGAVRPAVVAGADRGRAGRGGARCAGRRHDADVDRARALRRGGADPLGGRPAACLARARRPQRVALGTSGAAASTGSTSGSSSR